MRKNRDYFPKAKSPAKRGLSFLLAGMMAFSAIAPGVGGAYNAYAVTPDRPVNSDGSIPNGNKPQDTINTEEVYINDTPLRLQVSKVKTAQGDHEGKNPKTVETDLVDTITYELSGRHEGAEHDLMDKYGADNIELAYSNSGTYLGYGWEKGMLEYLTQRKLQGVDMDLDIKYNQEGIFEGYAYITRKLETADDVNRYVAGATMTLYDAVEIYYDPSADYDMDDKWEGVTVVREPGSNNVQMVYVNKGHAGTRIEYVLQEEDPDKIYEDGYSVTVNDNYRYEDAINDEGDGVWIAKTIQREDTPILFYSFDNLHVTTNDEYSTNRTENQKKVDDVFGSQRYNKEDSLYGFDKDGNVINADQYDNRDFTIFAFEDGENKPVFEFEGSNYRNIHYSQNEKKFRFYDEDRNEDKYMRMYHLDEDGNRDALVDPTTGIAFLTEHIKPLPSEADHDEHAEQYNLHYPNDYFISDKDVKFFVWPVNTFYDGTGNADDNTKGSHYFQKIITTRPATINADTPEEYVFGTLDGDKFENSLNPVLDQYGHPVYNRVSQDTYVKGHDRYDYDDVEYLGYTYEDGLDVWNENAYVINDHYTLYNTDMDDPFNQETHYQYTDKQPIKVTVDVDNNFVVNGKGSVPVPSREGYVFAGWLMDPDQLTDGCTVKAYWRNGNNSMSADDEAMWYSARGAEGQTKTLTVTFDANGGAFRAGQGDIHSTDFILYRRLGDAYIINNTWVTGENTPNDPFDNTLVDTVGNTAAGKNTISSDGLTGNDPYSSSTHSGGQADMLKRLPRSLYIMEELEAPKGYVKGMPVPVTFNEMTIVQQAEMTDHTIKFEPVKIDGTKDRNMQIRRDGELVVTDGGEPVTKLEPKGSYSYKHVPGATLSVTANDAASKKALSDWVKVTSNDDIIKKDSGGTWHFEFDTTVPLFLEGIPAGSYTLTEVKTPPGYVTMDPSEFTLGEFDFVQSVRAYDDHIKVEIEKYWVDDDGIKKPMSNANPATLSIYDSNGKLVDSWETDDASDYTSGGTQKETVPEGNLFTRAVKAVAGLFKAKKASDSVDYTAFTTHFQTVYNESHGEEMDAITWNVKRVAELHGSSMEGVEKWHVSDGTEVMVVNGIVPDDAPAGFAEAYEAKEQGAGTIEYAETLSAVKDKELTTSLGDQYWNMPDGTVIHICVSVDDDSSSEGYQSYVMDYQFDWRKLGGEYGDAVTYLTVDGTRRYDYLPAGLYKLHETKVPEGFVAPAVKDMCVEATADIQIFTLENKKREMKVSKYTVDGEGRYFAGYYGNEAHYTDDQSKAAVVAGVELELYRSGTQIADPASAFADGRTPEAAKLVDRWVTGSDGNYTQYEYDRELITKEQVGQPKPHTVTDAADGWYYLVERQGMSYMLDAAPVELHVTEATTDKEITSYAMANRAAPLAVRIEKTDMNGAPLEGAVFEITNKDTGAVVGTLSTDAEGKASLNLADTGKFGQDGRLVPYTFVAKETIAPNGYMLNAEQHEFTLTEQNDGYACTMFNNSDSSLSGGVLHIKDEPSVFSISKKDLYSRDVVPGTVLEIREAEFADGKWQAKGETRAEWTWIVKDGEDEYGLRGISPDTAYVLHEAKAPSGYTMQGDVFFHINKNGQAIDRIWTDPEEVQYVSFDVNANGEVEAMHTSTRTALGTKAVITDLDNGQSFEKGVERNGRVVLTAQEVTEGHRYSARFYVTMSDGSVHAVDSVTFQAELVDNEVLVWGQNAADTSVVITDAEGNKVYEIAADGNDTVILNPEAGRADSLTVADVSRAGKDRSGVKAGDVITYQVSWHGKGKEIRVYPSEGLTITRTEPGALPAGDGSYIYETEEESGTLTVTANVGNNALTAVSMKAVSGNSQLTYMNPVVTSGETGFYARNDSLVVSNAAEGTDPENGTAEFTYTVTLTDGSGNPLGGSYDYRTRLYNGALNAFGEQKSFTMILTGDDYLVVNSLPEGTRYKIEAATKVNEGFKADRTVAEGVIGEYETVSEMFVNTRNIASERALLKKGQSYFLNETVKLSDRSHVTAGYGFTLDEKCRVVNFILLNRPSMAEVQKLAKESQTMLAGAVLAITDEDGNVLSDAEGNELTWTSTKETKVFEGILDPGRTYYLKEVSAPEGYAMSGPIPFTVSGDGAVDRVIMQDSVTDVQFKKTDAKTGKSLPGAVLQVIDKDGSVVAQWTTDETGIFQLRGKLKAGETYTLHEEETVKGYYYSYDVQFVVNTDGSSQTIEMRNRPIIVVNPEEFPDEPEPTGTHPSYVMEKERVSKAPAKKDTDRFGFFRGDRVLYDVTITNNGETRLTMDVDDAFEIPGYFSTPEVDSVRYYAEGSSTPSVRLGKTNSITGSRANITIEAGAHAVVRYAAYVLDDTPESLSANTVDDGLGYLNTAITYNVVGIAREYSGEDKDGDGKGDIVTEKTVTKEDYPEELGDKEDTANTPVQEPEGSFEPEEPVPSYVMDKERTTPAPKKDGTARYGFRHGDTVTYEAHIENTGELPLKMYVSDEFTPAARGYFDGLKITKIEGAEDISESGMGVGQTAARIRLLPGKTATVTFTATVNGSAPENLAFTAADDGHGYLNIVKTYNVKAEKPDGTEGGPEEYPGIPDEEDDANTPVQEPEKPEEPTPSYVMDKTRPTPAPKKEGTARYGFRRGDTVTYEANITNTGDMALKMYVSDEFADNAKGYFEDLKITKIENAEDISEGSSGIGTDTARIRLEPGKTATITFTATVSQSAPENLAFAAKDDGHGYLNVVKTYNVKAEKPDGTEGGPDEYPGIPDKEDDAHTPVQEEPEEPGDPTPSYVMDKERTTEAPEKGETARFGFFKGDTVTYEAHITNTGDLPLKMFVSDAYAPAARDYFEGLQITKIEGAEDISEGGMGIGKDTARIRLMPGRTATVTFTATVSESAPESLSLMAKDDGYGYLNTVRTYNVKAEKPDGTEGGPEEYPGIPDKEDEANTPVQEPSEEHEDYPFIWLMKGDKALMGTLNQPVLPGGEYQVISKAADGTETVIAEITDPDNDGGFTMTGSWKQWDIVLEADKTYYLRETKAPAGYILPEGDTAFTVSHYGEDVTAAVYNDKTKASFEKADFAGAEVTGAECELYVMQAGGWSRIDAWTSQAGGPHTIEGVLETGKDYLYKEAAAPDGYAYSASIRFTLAQDGTITRARYVDEAGKTLAYDKDGRATEVIVTETLAGTSYQLGDEELSLVDGNLADKAGNVIVEGAAVEIPVEDNVVIMKDDAIAATFEKTDFAGAEVEGATCTLSEKKADGTVAQIDRWVSEEGVSHTMENSLKAGSTYIYHEEKAPEGYGYSYDIEFTVGRDGKIRDAHYLDPDGNKVLYDRDGFPTSITALEDGTYRDGAKPVTINEDGDAVNSDGTVIAKGVKLDIPVTDNVVTMKDEPVKVLFTKYDDSGNALEGGSYSICTADGKAVKAVKDTSIPSLEHEGMILEGEDLTFSVRKTGLRIDGLLEAGQSYILKENEAPEGYSVSGTGTAFTAPVYNQKAPVAVAMADQKIPARFAKADEDGNLIAGASLELHEKKEDGTWKLIRTWRSTTSAMVLDGILVAGKEYRYHEVKAPDGYRAAPDILFTVDAAGVIRDARYDGDDAEVKVINNTIEMTDKPMEAWFAKTDFAGKEVEGAGCILYKKEADGTRTQIEAWTSGKEPHHIPGKLAAGSTYIYHEEAAPEGYAYSEDIEFTIGADGNITSAHYINSDGETILYDGEGFPTTITVQEDGTYKDGDAAVTVNEDGDAADGEGNVIAEGVKKDIPVVDNVVVMKDAPTGVTIKKADSKTGESLAGARLQVIDKDGNTVAEWTTDTTGTFKLENILTAGETYTLHEEETPDGYYYSRDVEFSVNGDGRPQTVEMRDHEIIVVTPPDGPDEPDPEKPIIWLLKHAVGDPDHILQGGTFQVLSEDKSEVLIDSFTMDGTWQEWDVILKAGHSYWLHETETPEGYAKAEDVKFTVSHYGEDVTADMLDEPTKVIFKKTDQLTKVSLAGAVLQVYKGPKKEPYAKYDEADKVAEWTTDETGIFRLTGTLEAGKTYTLREQETVDGYYYSYDIEFVVNTDGAEQTVEMQNRKIIVEVPPDELPKPEPEPEGTVPEYTMEKERTSPAPAKAGTDKFGFFHGDKVLYDVTIRNTGEITLSMDVDDAYEIPANFTTPKVEAVRFYASSTGRQTSTKGSLNSISGSVANITIQPGGYAVVTYSAYVKEQAKESLSNAAADDGLGYLNTATTSKVVGFYKEYSGEDEDGDGKGDTVTEKTVTKEDYPDELGDKEDTANTPVQEPGDGTDEPVPSYVMDKTRPTPAPEKEGTDRYGFFRGDKVTYEAHITNTGEMPLKMYVSDEYAYEVRTYFTDPVIVKIEGAEDISPDGMGVGEATARIRLMPGEEAVVTYEASVTQAAPERLAFLSEDDGNGYLNTVRTYEVRAEKEDGTEGGPDEYPGIPDKEDDAHTPVQTTEEPPEENPPGPNEPEYPVIWLLKNSVNDPSHILPGGTFQLLDEEGNAVTDVIDAGDDKFGIGNTWKQWIEVLKADRTYWLHEVTPPEGYLPAEDVKFTVGHYGERVEAVMTDKRKNDGITFSKQDFAGEEVAGATCELYEYEGGETTKHIETWVSTTADHVIKGKLEPGKTYLYHEEKAPDGYGYSVDVVFTVDAEGNVGIAHYVDADGSTILFDRDGYPTEIIAEEDGTYSYKGKEASISADGDAINAEGEILAYGVGKDIPVTGNTVIIKDEPIKVRVIKTDMAGNAVSGGRFAILDAGKKQAKAISDTEIPSTEHGGFIHKGESLVFAATGSGVEITKQLNAGEEYYLRELEAPEGYTLADDVMFTIPYAKPGMTTLVRMKDGKTEVRFTKEDFAGKEVEGAECILYVKEEDGTRTQIDAWTSTKEEHVLTGELSSGKTYIYHEAKAPDGYGYSEDIKFTVDGDGSITEAHYINSRGETILYDKDGYQTSITVQEDGTYKDGDTAVTVNEDGNAVDGEGNVIAEGVGKDIPVEGNVVTMKDAPTDTTIKKTDSKTGDSLAGATLQVIDKDGETVAEWTTDESGTFRLAKKLTAGETYTLREKETVDGYYYSRDITFTVSRDGKPQTVEMRNREIIVVTPPDEPDEPNPEKPIIWLLKHAVGDPDHILRGGTFQILSEDKSEVLIDSFTMDGTWQEWDVVLKADHSYWFHEVTPPEGYAAAEDVEFTVSHYGEDITVDMEDEPTTTIIRKTDKRTGRSLAGATLQLLDKDKKVIREWTTDETGTFSVEGLVKGETYTLHESGTPDGYYYSYDVQFTVEGGAGQEVVMTNREIIVVTPPDEYPDPEPKPQGTHPDYELEKERVSLAPEKKGTEEFGFFRGDKVLYDVTVTNTGETDLSMTVTDTFEKAEYFTVPKATGVKFYSHEGHEGTTMGSIVSLSGNEAKIKLAVGGYAVVRYEAYVLDEAKELLSGHAIDDGLGYLNTARSTDVVGTYTEWTGDDNDGDGKGDTPVEKTVTKGDYPDELGDKEDTANTPVQEPKEKPEEPRPSYVMDKSRPTPAPAKEGTERYGFKRGDTVAYEAHITNTGELPLKMYVSDEYAPAAKEYFEGLRITKIEGAEDISGRGMGVGEDTARIRLMPGKTATVTFTATVGKDAPENLAFHAADDGHGYLNTVRTYDVKAEKPDGTEGGSDEYPEIPDKEDEANTPVQEPEKPEEPTPSYVMDKERPTLAPAKEGTERYGFHHGDEVTYEVHIENTGEMALKMYVSDEFAPAAKSYFEGLAITKIEGAEDISPEGMGIGEDTARIRLEPGSKATVTFTATVSQTAPENLAFHAEADGHGYLNVAKTYSVKAEKPDGTEGGPEEYPEIPDKKDEEDTPVQEPEEPVPSYVMDKERPTPAPEKEGTDRYGFFRGDSVDYDVHITNTGEMPLTMYVTDEFDYRIRKYFTEPVIKKADATLIAENGTGIGTGTVKIRLEPGEEATVTFTANVADTAPEKLAFHAADDGTGYLNIAKTYNVRAEKPDGTEGGPDEYPGIPDKEDEANTPVQTEDEKPDYPYIWLMKNSIDDPDHVLPGGTFQVLSEDKTEVLIESFTMNSTWQQWGPVLVADQTYWFHEVTPPEGYLPADDVKFTVSHYGEDIHVSMTDEPIDDEVVFAKEDLSGTSIKGASLVVKGKDTDEAYAWVSDGTPHLLKGELEPGRTYIYHEEKAPEGYARSADIEFTLDGTGVVANAHYVDEDGVPLLYDRDGYVTGIRANADGSYEHEGEEVRIDRDGNAVKDKKVIAEGVKLDIPVAGNKVTMKDAPTDVTIRKSDSKTGLSLAGATLQVIGKDGETVAEWTTDNSGTFRLEKKLIAGETYTLREKETVDGYYYSRDITFTVNRDGKPQTVEMRNREIIVVTPPDEPDEPNPEKPIIWLLKHEVGDPDHILQGGTFQILSEDKSEVLIESFTMDGSWQEWDVVLEADRTYWLHETEAPEGYAKAEDVEFTVSHYGEDVTVDMEDEPTDQVFEKKDAVTGKSLAGATLQVKTKDNKVIEEWTTDATGTFRMKNRLVAGETYILHEKDTVEGYYYSRDVEFTVNADGESQIIQMHNRPIIVVTPPDETPEPEPEPQGTHPDYELEKERVSLAPAKKGTDEFGFFRGDKVLYDVTVTNTGETDLSMTVTDTFEEAGYFSIPEATGVRFYHKDGREGTTMGSIVSLNGNEAKIKLAVGGYAVVRYEAYVLDAAKELLSGHAVDDGLGYLNTARTTDVVGTYTEYTGDDNDGDGKGDTPVEKTVTKEDYPDELGDKEDTANTPVQEPKEDGENPSYVMDKTRPTPAPAKEGTEMYGFKRGDTVAYDVHITNTGDMPLTMYVSDEFDYRIRKHFEDLQITKVDGTAIEEDGTGIGTTVAKIRLEPGEEAVVTFTAKVAQTAPEKLSYHAADDGNGYLNIARTYNVKAQKEDGTEGGPDEYPGIPDKEDEGHTPVQTDDNPDYPYIWLLKNSIEDPDHILQGGTFQVLSEDKEHILIDSFTMNGTWQQWGPVLEADKSYWLHEVSAPAGYKKAEDVKFTVDHYGEDVHAVMTDEKLPTVVTFTKEDFAGTEIPGAECELRRVEPNGTTTRIDSWTSGDEPHVMEDTLSGSTTYRYHEEKAPEGYGYSEDIEFTLDENGKVTDAHYVDKDGNPVLYDKDGFQTTITVMPDGTYRDGETKVTINRDGNAVDWLGRIHAEGVKLQIEVVGNVIRMKDAPTKALILKQSADGEPLSGGQFVICRADGTVLEALRDTNIPSTEHEGSILKGEAVRFAAQGDGVEMTALLNGSEAYILREEKAPAGYELASDVKFTVPRDGKPITVTMHDEKTPEEPKPSYVMDKTRPTPAPAKEGTERYGFKRGDTVTYEAHIENTGELALKMYVSDEFAGDAREYFENLQITKIEGAEDISEEGAGIGTDTARIRLTLGGKATVTFTATVAQSAPENLAFKAEDDGHGYLNVVKTYSVKAEKPDGTEGGPEEYPGIPDKEDDAHTPVQEPEKPEEPTPSYTMDKERTSDAPEKGSTARYGFRRGDTVTYEAHIENTGKLPLKMYVSDEFADSAKGYFEGLKITRIEGAEDISESGMGVGQTTARIRLMPGKTATITFTATVSQSAPENLAFAAKDDGHGYENVVKTYNVKAEKPDGTEGGPDEYPGIPDKEDDADTPVQVPTTPGKPSGGGPSPSKPYVTVYKYDGNTMDPIGGVTFQVYKDGAELRTVKTDKSGYARVSSLDDGEYRIVEAEAAEGYKPTTQEFSFTVSGGAVSGGVTTFHVANYKETAVTVYKRDGDNGTPLKGAKLRIADEDGGVAYEGTTDKDGKITFKVTKPGHYAVIELEAPAGYDVVDGYITFHVAEDGAVSGTTTMYDYKKERKGKISARYENGFERGGWYDSEGRWHKLPRTGDEPDNSAMPYLFGVFAASMCGIAILSRKKKKKKA